MKTGVMTSWKYKYFNSAIYDREVPGSFGVFLLKSTWGAKPTDKHQTEHIHAMPQQYYVKEVVFACQCIHECIHVHPYISQDHSYFSVVSPCAWLCQLAVHTDNSRQIKQDLLWMLSFALFNHEKSCFVASKPWFMLHLSQVHLHPQPFAMLPDPSTSSTECGGKWDDTGTAHPLSASLVTSIGYHIKLLQTFVNNLLFPCWLRKQYNFLESKIFRWMM